MMGKRQLILPLGGYPQLTLEGYYPVPNAEALCAVQNLLGGERRNPSLYLHGPSGAGKSHLLQGAAAAVPGWVPYIDCKEVTTPFGAATTAEAFASLAAAPLLCLDNIDAWAGQRDKEIFCFDLYNERMRIQKPILFASRQAPQIANWVLPDWASRVTACLQYVLHLPNDAERRVVLQEMAQRRGLRMGEDVARYLLRHHPRDLGALDRLLNLLDTRSWECQRELTIPFVRLCLAEGRPS